MITASKFSWERSQTIRSLLILNFSLGTHLCSVVLIAKYIHYYRDVHHSNFIVY